MSKSKPPKKKPVEKVRSEKSKPAPKSAAKKPAKSSLFEVEKRTKKEDSKIDEKTNNAVPDVDINANNAVPDVDDNEETIEYKPKQKTRAIPAPLILLVVTVIGLGAYAAKVQGNLNEANKRESDLKANLSKAQDDLRMVSALRDDERAKHKETKDQLEEQVASLESALDSTKTTVGELKDEKKQATKELTQFKAFSAQFKRMVDAGKLEVVFRRGRMVVNLPAQVLFDSGSAELSEEGGEALVEVAKILKTVKNKRFIVGGHTDDRRILKANYESNWELATARATVVTKALIKSGIRPWNLIAAGYSQYAPIASNKSDIGRKRNRRIEIILEPYLKDIEPPRTKPKK